MILLPAGRALLVITVAVWVCCGSVATARAALEIRVQHTPEVIRVGVTDQIRYTVQLAASGQEERFSFGFQASSFGTWRGRPIEGSPLVFVGETLALTGGTLLGPARQVSGIPACAPGVPPHGLDLESRTWDVLVPADRTAVATLDFVLTQHLPWPDTSYGVTFLADARLVSGQPSTLAASLRVRATGPPVRGRRAVHIRLSSRPRSSIPSIADARVRRGRPITIRGATSPMLRRAKVVVTVVGPLPSQSKVRIRRIAVRTDRRGRFVLRRLRLGKRGAYQVGAYARPKADGVAGDYTCPLGFRIR